MAFLSRSWCRHTLLIFSAFLLWLLLVPISRAAPLMVPGSATTLESDGGRMISYRHQEHVWQTSDGAIHLVMNRGAQTNASLVLYSSFDAGSSWSVMHTLSNTGKYSTADGVLIGNELSLIYPSVKGGILFTTLLYDQTLKNWSLVKNEIAFASSRISGSNPAIAIDSQATVWCAFVARDTVSSETNIKLIQRVSDTPWLDTGLTFGPTNNTSQERSARLVVLSDGVGVVYTVRENIFWAYRLNHWPLVQPWVEQNLFTSAPPYDADPYASHFSLAADSQKNLHMAVVDHGQVLYFRFNNLNQAWSAPRALTANVAAEYVQVSTTLDTLAIFFNSATFLKVFQSVDFGDKFSFTHLLTHETPGPGSTLDYGKPRIETPGLALGPIPVFQQYQEGALQKLMYFEVSTNGPQALRSETY